MKISYKWLKEFVDIKTSPEELANDLSLFGQEVDSIEKKGDDSVLNFEITPNRGDCLSILGMAREVAALYGLDIKTENLKTDIKSEDIGKTIQVKIEDPKICPRFTARIIDGVKIGESPKWMQEKLASYGFRPVNNIVDITNYIMVMQGQPLHAFGYDKIKDGQMFIRKAKKGEEVMTLDGQNHDLPEGAIIIEDEEKIYDLAGIMGGFKSEVDENTKTIILVGSIFDPVLIRKASKFLNHTTDASYRYERGVDFEGTTIGVDLAAKLILDECEDSKAGGIIDSWTPACVKYFADEGIGQKQWQCQKIDVEKEKVNHLLGLDLSVDEMADKLKSLNMEVEISGENLIVTPPSYRFYDITIWQDVAEEVARMVGYNNIGASQMEKESVEEKNQEFINREVLKDKLKKIGFTEISSYPFIDKKQAEILGIKIDDLVEIEKPLSLETQFLKPSLESSLLTAISRNPWAPEVNIFEIGKAFEKTGEKWQLGMAVVGKGNQLLSQALKELIIDAQVKNIDQKVLDSYKIRRPVSIVIFDIQKIGEQEGEHSLDFPKVKYQKVSNFPPTVRDLAFVVAEDIDSEEIISKIKKISSKVLFVELFDEFASDKLGQGKKSLAYHIWLQDLEKPMDEKEVESIIKNIIETISKDFKAQLRS